MDCLASVKTTYILGKRPFTVRKQKQRWMDRLGFQFALFRYVHLPWNLTWTWVDLSKTTNDGFHPQTERKCVYPAYVAVWNSSIYICVKVAKMARAIAIIRNNPCRVDLILIFPRSLNSIRLGKAASFELRRPGRSITTINSVGIYIALKQRRRTNGSRLQDVKRWDAGHPGIKSKVAQ